MFLIACNCACNLRVRKKKIEASAAVYVILKNKGKKGFAECYVQIVYLIVTL